MAAPVKTLHHVSGAGRRLSTCNRHSSSEIVAERGTRPQDAVGFTPQRKREPDAIAEALSQENLPTGERLLAPGDRSAVGRRGLRAPSLSRDAIEQQAGVGMLRVIEDGLGVPSFHDLSLPHDHDVVGRLANNGEVMGDEQMAHGGLIADIAELVQDVGLDGHVERGERFVEDQDLRLGRQGAMHTR